MSNNVVSARSVFEQNIQKNKEAGFGDRTILGQKPSRRITNRLFAQKRFYNKPQGTTAGGTAGNTGSSANGGLGDSNRSLNSNSRSNTGENVPLRTSFHGNSKSYDFNSHSKDQNSERQAEVPLHSSANTSGTCTEPAEPCSSGHRRTGSTCSNSSSSQHHHVASVSEQQQQQHQHQQLDDSSSSSGNAPESFAKKKRDGSISSLADHLGTLNLSISRGRSGCDLPETSTLNSQAAHSPPKHVKLPDFRRPSSRSQATRPTGVNNSNTIQRRFNHSGTHNESLSSLDNSSQNNNLDTSYESYQGLRRSSNSRRGVPQIRPAADHSLESLSGGAQHQPERIELRRSSSSRKSSSSRTLSSSSSSAAASNRGKLMRHLAKEGSIRQNNNSDDENLSIHSEQIAMTTRSKVSWSRSRSQRSTSSSSGHGPVVASSGVEPLKTVPFPTRTVIKRHNSNKKIGEQQPQQQKNSSRSTSPPTASSYLTRRNSTGGKRSMSRKQLVEEQSQHDQQPPDAREQELLDEIEKLKVQITGAETKAVQVKAGEKADLKRIQETKDRKLRRIQSTEKQQQHQRHNNDSNDDYEYELELEEKCKKAQTTIVNLKKENAKIHDEIRQLKIQILTTASSNGLLEESKGEMDRYNADLEKEQKHQQREHDQLLEIIASYQKSISVVEETLALKDPQISRIKKMRFHYEDRIDEIMDLIRAKCFDPELVEELASMAQDESGWDGDWSELPNERTRMSVVTQTPPYTNMGGDDKEEDRESPKSVADLISTSSHSLHIFREDY